MWFLVVAAVSCCLLLSVYVPARGPNIPGCLLMLLMLQLMLLLLLLLHCTLDLPKQLSDKAAPWISLNSLLIRLHSDFLKQLADKAALWISLNRLPCDMSSLINFDARRGRGEQVVTSLSHDSFSFSVLFVFRKSMIVFCRSSKTRGQGALLVFVLFQFSRWTRTGWCFHRL